MSVTTSDDSFEHCCWDPQSAQTVWAMYRSGAAFGHIISQMKCLRMFHLTYGDGRHCGCWVVLYKRQPVQIQNDLLREGGWEAFEVTIGEVDAAATAHRQKLDVSHAKSD